MTKQTNIKYDTEILGRLKVVAWKEMKTLTELVQELAEDKIKKYEKTNGAISQAEIDKMNK